MFRRRIKRNFFENFVACIWPQMGWLRAFKYYITKASRTPGSSRLVASGFAIGGSVSCTPLVGAHFFISAFIAKLSGRNVIAALLGTILGNPITFPFIWAGSYLLGSFTFDFVSNGFSFTATEVAFRGNAANIKSGLVHHMASDVLRGNFSDKLLLTFSKMMIGGTIMGLIAFPIIFYTVLPQIEKFRKKASNHILNKVRA